MARYRHPRCDVCTTRAVQGWPGDQPQRCTAHKLEGMVDLTSPRCAPCLAGGKYCRPSFGFPGDGRPSVCAKHKQPGMLMLNSRYCVVCREQGVWHHATYRMPGGLRTHCFTHHLPGMVKRASPKGQRRPRPQPRNLSALHVAPLVGAVDEPGWACLSAIVCSHINKTAWLAPADAPPPAVIGCE